MLANRWEAVNSLINTKSFDRSLLIYSGFFMIILIGLLQAIIQLQDTLLNEYAPANPVTGDISPKSTAITALSPYSRPGGKVNSPI